MVITQRESPHCLVGVLLSDVHQCITQLVTIDHAGRDLATKVMLQGLFVSEAEISHIRVLAIDAHNQVESRSLPLSKVRTTS